MTDARVAQQFVEVLASTTDPGDVRVSQQFVEVLASSTDPGDIQIAQQFVEVLRPVYGAFEEALLNHAPNAWYRFNEESGSVLKDWSGNGLNGTYYNSPTLGTASVIPSAPNSRSVTFAASSSQYATSAADSSLDLVATSEDHTIVWAVSTPGGNVDMRNNSGVGVQGFYLYDDGTSRIYGGSNTISSTDYNYWNDSTPLLKIVRISDGATQNASRFVRDPRGIWQYENGTTASATNSSPWYMGKNGTNAQYVDCTFGCWAYIPSALTNAEIIELCELFNPQQMPWRANQVTRISTARASRW